jgi:hypothetical protein
MRIILHKFYKLMKKLSFMDLETIGDTQIGSYTGKFIQPRRENKVNENYEFSCVGPSIEPSGLAIPDEIPDKEYLIYFH